MEYADKKRASEWLSKQRYNSAEVRQLYKRTAKVVQDFENPKLPKRTEFSNEVFREEPEFAGELLNAKSEQEKYEDKKRAVVEDLSKRFGVKINIAGAKDCTSDSKRNAKGWFNTKSESLYINLDNNKDVDDVERTILHEVVGHYGMRKLLGEKYDALCSEVFDFMPSDMQEQSMRKARESGTWMKAPNGADSKLTAEEWITVRTKAFKDGFGDWEKTARIEKLRQSKPVEITGKEYEGKYELSRDSVRAWMKENLRGSYTNDDTGETVKVIRKGIEKLLSHGERDVFHLQSIVAIADIIQNSIFIEERNNEKYNSRYDLYRYYACGLKIGTTDYTIKVVVGVKDGSKYYDHELTQIEKGTLINTLNLLPNEEHKNQTSLSEYKDKRLLSILQTNSSKAVDANGEPLTSEEKRREEKRREEKRREEKRREEKRREEKRREESRL